MSRVGAFWRDVFVVVRELIGAGQVSELLADYDRALRGEIAAPAFGDRRVTGAEANLAKPVRRSTWFWSPERTMPTTSGGST